MFFQADSNCSIDGVARGVLVDDFEHRDLIGPAFFSWRSFERYVTAVSPSRVVQLATKEDVGTLGGSDVLLTRVDVDQQVHAFAAGS
ncbi:hypothetical protein [Ornithinimicrobium panacihumi]|uniref:hypothetical protein n=1 Tax=Ornithinimicrobium panacihumi TaxID=2008449 RepID=UPI003F8B0280